MKIKEVVSIFKKIIICLLLISLFPINILTANATESSLVDYAQSPKTATVEQYVYIPDADLKGHILDTLKINEDREVTVAEMRTITKLQCTNAIGDGIEDLTGIEYASNLEILLLWNNSCSTLENLRNLKELRWLDLCGNNMTSIEPILKLPIKVLDLCYNPQITDLQLIQNITTIESLWLKGMQLTGDDLNYLDKLTELNTVFFGDNNIDSLYFLTKAPKLKRINIDSNNVHSLCPLTCLQKLRTIDCTNNKISDVSPLITVLQNVSNDNPSGDNRYYLSGNYIDTEGESPSVGDLKIIKSFIKKDQYYECESVDIPVEVQSVSIERPFIEMKVGEQVSLEYLIEPDDSTVKSTRWYSSNTDVATVDKEGEITALSVGTTVITVKTLNKGKSDTCEVTVNGDGGGNIEDIEDGNVEGGNEEDKCFIATACFGSKYKPAVVLLRQFRDKCLLTNSIGQAFVRYYYANSPPIANYISKSEGLKLLTRIILTPLICIAYIALHPIYLVLILCGLFWFKKLKLIDINQAKR